MDKEKQPKKTSAQKEKGSESQPTGASQSVEADDSLETDFGGMTLRTGKVVGQGSRHWQGTHWSVINSGPPLCWGYTTVLAPGTSSASSSAAKASIASVGSSNSTSSAVSTIGAESTQSGVGLGVTGRFIPTSEDDSSFGSAAPPPLNSSSKNDATQGAAAAVIDNSIGSTVPTAQSSLNNASTSIQTESGPVTRSRAGKNASTTRGAAAPLTDVVTVSAGTSAAARGIGPKRDNYQTGCRPKVRQTVAGKKKAEAKAAALKEEDEEEEQTED